MKTLRCLLLLAALVPSVACLPGKDSCSGGVNMTSPGLVEGLEQDDGGSYFRIGWETGTGHGADLPPTYFAAAKLGAPLEIGLILPGVEPAAQPNQLRVDVWEAALTDLWTRSTSLYFELIFPDRADFTACDHPGAPQSYYLDSRLTLAPDGGLVGSFTEEPGAEYY